MNPDRTVPSLITCPRSRLAMIRSCGWKPLAWPPRWRGVHREDAANTVVAGRHRLELGGRAAAAGHGPGPGAEREFLAGVAVVLAGRSLFGAARRRRGEPAGHGPVRSHGH